MNVRFQIDRLIALQAAEWYERVKDGTNEPNADFVQWLAESPRHMEAFLSIAGEALAMRKVFESGAFDLAELLRRARPEVVELPVAAALAHPAQTPQRRWRRRIHMRSVAAAVAILLLGTMLFYQWASWQHFETPVGEQRTVQLVEGSVVNLNARSRLDVRFDDSQRDIKLPRGEATFKVTPDPARPFRVRTPAAVVEAVGTQFNVYARPDGTTSVAVLEGKVKVTSARSGSAASVALAAGEEAQVLPDGRIQREEHASVAEAVAWQQRKLIFKRTALEDMTAEFNRYNKLTQIRLENIEPGRFRFSGAFDADDPQSLATLLSREPDLAVERRGDEIVIRSR
ncbi:MAG TPA: FecR domain-containing protein [Steroidobacteraceae bacterium]|nr:FecR domain-containing protein [Steroidobacteraceae bacterium]